MLLQKLTRFVSEHLSRRINPYGRRLSLFKPAPGDPKGERTYNAPSESASMVLCPTVASEGIAMLAQLEDRGEEKGVFPSPPVPAFADTGRVGRSSSLGEAERAQELLAVLEVLSPVSWANFSTLRGVTGLGSRLLLGCALELISEGLVSFERRRTGTSLAAFSLTAAGREILKGYRERPISRCEPRASARPKGGVG